MILAMDAENFWSSYLENSFSYKIRERWLLYCCLSTNCHGFAKNTWFSQSVSGKYTIKMLAFLFWRPSFRAFQILHTISCYLPRKVSTPLIYITLGGAYQVFNFQSLNVDYISMHFSILYTSTIQEKKFLYFYIIKHVGLEKIEGFWTYILLSASVSVDWIKLKKCAFVCIKKIVIQRNKTEASINCKNVHSQRKKNNLLTKIKVHLILILWCFLFC